MLTNLCFGLICLLIPVLIELFNLQAGLPISNRGHTLVEMLILGGFYGLLMQILRLDAWLYLRNIYQPHPPLQPKRRLASSESPVPPVLLAGQTQIQPPRAGAFHWPRLPIENTLKHHRTVKP